MVNIISILYTELPGRNGSLRATGCVNRVGRLWEATHLVPVYSVWGVAASIGGVIVPTFVVPVVVPDS